MLCEWAVVTNALQPSSLVRAVVLRLFGAQIGPAVILRARLRVKHPWNLVIGARSWVGEGVWIHNQGLVTIGHDAVISQESFITTGSHDLHRTMDLTVRPVTVGNGAWIASRSVVLQGTVIGENAVVSAGSVVSGVLEPGLIYRGNPAVPVGRRGASWTR